MLKGKEYILPFRSIARFIVFTTLNTDDELSDQDVHDHSLLLEVSKFSFLRLLRDTPGHEYGRGHVTAY